MHTVKHSTKEVTKPVSVYTKQQEYFAAKALASLFTSLRTKATA